MESNYLRDGVMGYARVTTNLAMELDDEFRDLPLAEQLAIAEELDQAVKQIDVMVKAMRANVTEQMHKQGTKQGAFTGLDGFTYTVEIKTAVNRRKVQNEELVKAVEKAAASQERLVNPATGEVISEDFAKLSALKQAFRMEPRWTAIAGFGITDDEYCEKQFEVSSKITKAVAL